jgi:alkanesulfonate monooxygenase SsuD/methylene tetrahydromethanopterin reductase-like flavin-dependent oxidoreductase (luciferase family)
MFALGKSGPRPVGTPEMVADVFEKWWKEADIDGFNINCECVPLLSFDIGTNEC